MDYTVLDQAYADRLRNDFVERFTDRSLPFYQKVLRLRQYYDGMCYAGYMWEVLKKPYAVVDRDTALSLLDGKGCVYVMWDKRTMQKVAQAFQYRVPKDMIIQTDGKGLSEQLRSDLAGLRGKASFLPEDLYIFDGSLEWYIIFTHEPDENNRMMCMICS